MCAVLRRCILREFERLPQVRLGLNGTLATVNQLGEHHAEVKVHVGILRLRHQQCSQICLRIRMPRAPNSFRRHQ